MQVEELIIGGSGIHLEIAGVDDDAERCGNGQHDRAAGSETPSWWSGAGRRLHQVVDVRGPLAADLAGVGPLGDGVGEAEEARRPGPASRPAAGWPRIGNRSGWRRHYTAPGRRRHGAVVGHHQRQRIGRPRRKRMR